MSYIFLSHSSVDELEAIALKQWLLDNGWDDVFLALDPERGLRAGERWQEAVRRAADRCEAVVFLISPAWAKSVWCPTELMLAKSLNKLIFGVAVKQSALSSLPGGGGVGLPLIVAFTIRSDRYEPLQTAPELMGLKTVVFDALKAHAGGAVQGGHYRFGHARNLERQTGGGQAGSRAATAGRWRPRGRYPAALLTRKYKRSSSKHCMPHSSPGWPPSIRKTINLSVG
jgi:TIR domain